MPIEDIFSIQGRGTVVTGRIERGICKVGEEMEIVGCAPVTRAATERPPKAPTKNGGLDQQIRDHVVLGPDTREQDVGTLAPFGARHHPLHRFFLIDNPFGKLAEERVRLRFFQLAPPVQDRVG